MKKVMMSAAVVLAALTTGCATPTVVQTKQVNDSAMSCDQLKVAYQEAVEFENKARKEKGVTGTNIAAAILFPLAIAGTYKNADDAIDAARDRQRHLEKLGTEKNCRIV